VRIGVVGAGAIGSYLALELSTAGAPVVLLGRKGAPPTLDGLVALPLSGRRLTPGTDLLAADDPAQLADVDVCLVAVKSRDTSDVAAMLAQHARSDAVVISFQNGLRNAERLRAHLGDRALAGMVSYNVFRLADGSLQQATSGVLMVQHSARTYSRSERLRRLFASVGEHLEVRRDMDAVLAGKLLLNLNNGICAATGINVAPSLRDVDGRWCFAQCIREGIRCMKAVGIEPARVGALHAGLIARALVLPDALVMTMARSLASVTPQARSSTLVDLDRGRMTEIDELNGAIVWLAQRAGNPAPLNGLVTDIVHEHEQRAVAGEEPRYVAPGDLRRRMVELGA
jgi:2-dehydropantoate 2-reductase